MTTVIYYRMTKLLSQITNRQAFVRLALKTFLMQNISTITEVLTNNQQQLGMTT